MNNHVLDFGDAAPRQMVHHRRIECVAYARDDGLVDIDGWLLDTRGHELPTVRGLLPAGKPLHQMGMRLTVDLEHFVKAARAVTVNSPSPECPEITSSYDQLVGLQIGPGFRDKAKTLLAGRAGCTHLTELLGPIGTTALQATWWLRAKAQSGRVQIVKRETPGQTDSCYAWRKDGLIYERFLKQADVGSK